MTKRDPLLEAAFLTAVRFSTGVSGTPRPLIVVEVLADDRLKVIEQGVFRAVFRELTRDELVDIAWVDLTRSRLEALQSIYRTVLTWLAATPEVKEALPALIREGEKDVWHQNGRIPKPSLLAHQYDKPTVWIDHERRTCLRSPLTKETGGVYFVPMEHGEGFNLEFLTDKEFRGRFTQLPDYPIAKAARLYLSYALVAGATESALEFLGTLTTITPKERQMATSKRASKKAAAPAGNGRAKPKAVKKVAGAAPAPQPKAKKVVAAQARGRSGESAASMFQALIREGKKTDQQIFDEVQKKFGLDANKRGYVAWYRNFLKKKGERVSGPIESA